IRRMRSNGATAWRAGIYVASGAALFPVLYDRPDLLVGALLLLACALLVARSHWPMVMATLAGAINFKLVPILRAPAFIIARLRRGARSRRDFQDRNAADRSRRHRHEAGSRPAATRRHKRDVDRFHRPHIFRRDGDVKSPFAAVSPVARPTRAVLAARRGDPN